MHALSPAVGWYEPAPHGWQEVCVPADAWLVPGLHGTHTGVDEAEHVPFMKDPWPHVVMQAAHAVCDPAVSW